MAKVIVKKNKKRISEFHKGKKWEEKYGEEKASELKKRQSERLIGKNNPLYKEIDITLVLEQLDKQPMLTMKEISEILNSSVYMIRSRFKEHTGKTFEEYKKEKYGKHTNARRGKRPHTTT